MELGIFTRVYQNHHVEKAFELIYQHGIKHVEITANRNSLHLDLDKALHADYRNQYDYLLTRYDLQISAISLHRDTHLVLGALGAPTQHFCPGNVEEQIAFGTQRALLAAEVAKEYGVEVVVGLLGCVNPSEWYPWPNKDGWNKQKEIAKNRWLPILEYYEKLGVKFAHEIGPQQIAYNLETAEEIYDLFDIGSFGFCADPSNLLMFGIDPVVSIERLGAKVIHTHAKDFELTHHLPISGWMAHGDLSRPDRGFRFRIPGWGDVNWRKLLTSLNIAGYNGVISMEIEDAFVKEEEAIRKTKEFMTPLLFD